MGQCWGGEGEECAAASMGGRARGAVAGSVGFDAREGRYGVGAWGIDETLGAWGAWNWRGILRWVSFVVVVVVWDIPTVNFLLQLSSILSPFGESFLSF